MNFKAKHSRVLFTALVISILYISNGFATHLVGGNIGYIYQGPAPGNPTSSLYIIYFQGYLDCNSPSWGTAFPETSIEVGVYEGGLTTSNLTYVTTIDLNLTDSNEVVPQVPPNCNFNTNTCFYLVQYSTTLTIPNSSNGFHVIYDRCCRPGGLTNLNNSGDQALTYMTHVPSQAGTIITNSTPIFTDTLLSYLCVTDSSVITNAVVDPDGDSLSFALVHPFDGETAPGNPVANYAGINPYPNPPPLVNFAAGYNLNNLFGTGSSQSINPTSGVLSITANQVGNYVAAVEISEWRNGTVINRSRRDMQLLVINCPNNDLPEQDTTNLDTSAVSPTIYSIKEGQSFCFDLEYDDPDNDSLFLTASGGVFNTNFVNPAATITAPTAGLGAVATQFCWNTTCNQGRNNPYSFSVNVRDNGCPPKTLFQTILIEVEDYTGPPEIVGQTTFCTNPAPSNYSVQGDTNETYFWTVSGGTILSGTGTNSILVDWGSSTVGQITLVTNSEFGCPGTPLTKDITVSNVAADAGNDASLCPGDSVQIGGPGTIVPAGGTFTWTPITGLDNPTLLTPFAKPDTTTTYILSINDTTNCLAADTVSITVFDSVDLGLADTYFTCPGDTISVNVQNANTILWTPNIGISNNTSLNPDFFPLTTTLYTYVYTDSNNCPGIDSLTVIRNIQVPTFAGNDVSICLGDTVQIGGLPTSPPFTTYQWIPAAGLNNDTIDSPLAAPIITTSYIVNTFNDTCLGVDTVTVFVNPQPSVSVLTQDTHICSVDTLMLEATGADTFTWNNGGFLNDSTIFNPMATITIAGDYTFVVQGANQFGCADSDSVFIRVNTPPAVDAGPDQSLCKSNNQLIGGAPTGYIGASYLWSPTAGLNDPTLANPIANLTNNQSFEVRITDSIGCTNTDSVSFEIFYVVLSDDTTLCESEPVQLNATPIAGVAPYEYVWSPSTGLSNDTIADPIAAASQSIVYQVIVSDSRGLGCADTAFYSLQVFPQAEASFTYESFFSCEGIIAEMQNNTTEAEFYEWLFGSTSVSTEENPAFEFTYGQSETVTLIATTTNGCNDTASALIEAEEFTENYDLNIPNIFTPNGDGLNDFFEIDINNRLQECTDLVMFNRWGQVVFQSAGTYHIWNGRTLNGEEADEGVYFYIFDVNGLEYKGNVHLVR